MASTTSRTVELNIKLSGVQTLEELEQVTSEINQDLKDIPLNSKAFTEMSQLAQKANVKLKQIDQNLEGITSAEKSEAVLKLGMGLVGAFQAAQGASLLFGEKTSEELEKVIAQVGGLFAVVDGVDKLFKAFTVKNIADLKKMVIGWKESTIAAKLFGTGVRAAITATGIGVLIVLLGTIVANWDKVKNATIKAFNVLKDYVPLFYVIDKAIDTIKEKFGNLKAFIAGVGAAIKAAFTFGGPSMSQAFDTAVKKSLELQSIDKQILDITTKQKQVLDDELEIMSAQGDKQLEIYNKQIEYNKKLQDTLELKKKTDELTDDEQKLLDETIQKTKVLVEQRKKFNADQAKAAAEKKKQLDEEAKREAEQAKKEAERLKKEAEDLRIKALVDEQNFREAINNLKQEEISLDRERQYLIDTYNAKSEQFLEEQTKAIEDGFKKENKQIDEKLKKQLVLLYVERKLLNIEDERLNSTEKALRDQLDLLKKKEEDIKNGLIYFESEYDKQVALKEITVDFIKLQNELLNVFTSQAEMTTKMNENAEKINKIYDKVMTPFKAFVNEQKKLIKEQYKEELQAAGDLTYQLFELRITQLQAVADFENKKLEEIQAKKDEYAQRNKDLNDLLADAEGERYDDILEQIKDNAKAIEMADAAEVESKRKIADAEYKMAKARRTQSIIDATIQGTLAVIEALPNILLAAIVGAMSVASIATILATPLPSKTEFAQGGIIGGQTTSGDKVNIRANSGEMILNEKQQANLFRVANVGSVTPNTSTNGGMIDYDLFSVKLVRALQDNPQFVSVVEFNSVQNRLKVVENRASLGK